MLLSSLSLSSGVSIGVVGLKLGADNYLTKPFEVIELPTRIEVLVQRYCSSSASSTNQSENSSDTYQFGSVKIDFRTAELSRGGVQVEISAQELRLLRYFIEHRGAAVSRNELLDAVRGYSARCLRRAPLKFISPVCGRKKKIIRVFRSTF